MKRLFATTVSNSAFSLAMFVLRAGMGALMIPHGIDKIKNFNKYLAVFGDPIHIGTKPTLYLDIFAELICSILIILGFLTRFATIPLLIAMSVALFISHHGDLFGQGEKAALYLVGFLTILITGPGRF